MDGFWQAVKIGVCTAPGAARPVQPRPQDFSQHFPDLSHGNLQMPSANP